MRQRKYPDTHFYIPDTLHSCIYIYSKLSLNRDRLLQGHEEAFFF